MQYGLFRTVDNTSMISQNKMLKIMFYLTSAVELVEVKICFAHLKVLGMRMRKLVLDLSVAEIFPGKINKILLPKECGFIEKRRSKIFY